MPLHPAEPGAPGRPPPLPLVETTRRDVLHPERPHAVESRHHGHLVLVGPGGSVRFALGDAERLTFVRSTAKPFQATACLEALSDNGVELPPDDEIAIAWASHRGEPLQVATVARLLSRSGRDATQLTCPSARPSGARTDVARRITHNCSGKHALFALAGDAVGCPPTRLLDPTAKLQKRILGVMSAVFGEPAVVSVDGCGAPAIAVPLERIAHAFADLASADRWRRVREAGTAHPHLVGGRRRLETALLSHGVVAKPGAGGVFGLGWVADDGPWGLAARTEDGDGVACSVAVHAAVTALGLVPRDAWRPPTVRGGGRPIGVRRAADGIREAVAAAVAG